jgi:hypothetical protein
MAGSAHAAGGGGMSDSQDDSDLGGETEVIIVKLVIILFRVLCSAVLHELTGCLCVFFIAEIRTRRSFTEISCQWETAKCIHSHPRKVVHY